MPVPHDDSPLTIRPARGPEEHPDLVEIWRSAVRATHDFLAASDFERIERALAPVYFPAVELLVAEREGRAQGFAGIAEHSLEMLFVADEARGRGIGSALLTEAIVGYGVTHVDVNEQNPAATGFYLHHGFTRIGRSELDGDGRPYPILHLQRGAV